MLKFTISRKQVVLLFILFAIIWITLPTAKDQADARARLQGETSPLETQQQDEIDARNIEAESVNRAVQPQSPLATPSEEEILEQPSESEVTAEPTLQDPPTAEPPTLAPPTVTAAPTSTPLPTQTNTPENTPTEAPARSDGDEPSDTPTADENLERVTAYPPEDGLPTPESTRDNLVGVDTVGIGTVVNNDMSNAPDQLSSIVNLESMILALLCLIFISINGLGTVALVVTILYIRSRRNSPYP